MYYIKYENTVVEAIDRVLKYTENEAELLAFTLIPSSPFFLKFKKFLTWLTVYEDNTKLRTFRVINTQKIMDTQGNLTEKITCEGALNLLNDVRCGKWAIHPGKATDDEIAWQSDEEKLNDPYVVYEYMNVKKYLKLLLDTYNSKVKDDRKIYIGNVNVEGDIYCYNKRETILNAILEKLVNKNGGIINLREVEGKYYLDYLEEIEHEEGLIEIGTNVVFYHSFNDLEAVYTRVIPLGADGLTIKSVNNGLEYIEDTELIKDYGVIEKTVEFTDVTLANILLTKAKKYLETVNNSSKIYEINAVDISYISDNFTKFKLSQNVKIINNLFNEIDVQRIVSISIPLDEPYNSTLNISALAPSSLRDLYSSEMEIENLKTDSNNLNNKVLQKVNKREYEETVSNIEGDFKSSNNKMTNQMKYIIMGV